MSDTLSAPGAYIDCSVCGAALRITGLERHHAWHAEQERAQDLTRSLMVGLRTELREGPT